MTYWIVSLLLSCTGGTRHVALVDDADQLTQGSAVMASGLQIGQVDSLALADDGVQVQLRISGDHTLVLHEDACVRVGRTGNQTTLEVDPGEEGTLTGPLRPCAVDLLDEVDQAIDKAAGHAKDIGRRLGRATRDLAEGFEEAIEEANEDGTEDETDR